eukprot:gene6375-8780_t
MLTRQNSIQNVQSTDQEGVKVVTVDRVLVSATSMVRTKVHHSHGSTDSSVPFENSSTNSFQKSYDERLLSQRIFPSDFTLLPKWNITLLNSKSTENTYMQNKLPSYRRWVNPVGVKETELYSDMKWDTLDSVYKRPRHYQRLQLKTVFTNPFDLEAFPYDIQVLNIIASLDSPMNVACFDTAWMAETFFERDKNTNEVVFREEGKNCVQYDSAYKNILVKTEWKPLIIYPEAIAQDDTGNKRTQCKTIIENSMYHRVIISIVIQRNAWYYNSTVLIPLIVVFVALCATFFVDDFFDKISYVSTLLLTVFSLKWFTSSNMPKISHNTIFDSFFIVTYGYLIVAMALAIYINIINPPNNNTESSSSELIAIALAIYGNITTHPNNVETNKNYNKNKVLFDDSYFTTITKGSSSENKNLSFGLLKVIYSSFPLLVIVFLLELMWWLFLCYLVVSQYTDFYKKNSNANVDSVDINDVSNKLSS